MNRLKSETSPYLKQHANNPVDWYPWGEDALQRAKDDNKLIFISIGYSACHWCHVMEHESFENQKVADILNENFISIKVDREERPDIDKSYMSAVQLMGVSGGWPLSCFATPEGKPFYGGTYYPADQFLEIISKLTGLWKNEPSKIVNHADRLCEGVQNSELIHSRDEKAELVEIESVFIKIRKEFDLEDGGLKRIPKFLTPSLYSFLLRFYFSSGKEDALRHGSFTLQKIINSGMYDQLDGGIARYSTDKKWFVPHFEKMLYDNSQFISLLAEFYQLNKNTEIHKKLIQCIQFTSEVFLSESGGYYSSLDADSEGIEGEFYTWKYKEIKEIAGKHFPIAEFYFGLQPEGNWIDDKNILSVINPVSALESKFKLEREEIENRISIIKKSLSNHRNARIKPALDDKIIASWNGMQIIALCDSWQATGDDKFLKMAEKTGRFILEQLVQKDGSLIRVVRTGIPGFLDDYAFVIKAFFKIYQISFEESWIEQARKLLEFSILNFYDESTSMFFYTSKNEMNPVARQTEITDSVIPSSNSVMAEVLMTASIFYDSLDYRKLSSQMLKNIQSYLLNNTTFFSNWASIQLLHKGSSSEVVITGERIHELRKGFCGNFLPGIVFAGTISQSNLGILKGRIIKNESRIYVCNNQTCKLPVNDVESALEQIKSNRIR